MQLHILEAMVVAVRAETMEAFMVVIVVDTAAVIGTLVAVDTVGAIGTLDMPAIDHQFIPSIRFTQSTLVIQ